MDYLSVLSDQFFYLFLILGVLFLLAILAITGVGPSERAILAGIILLWFFIMYYYTEKKKQRIEKALKAILEGKK